MQEIKFLCQLCFKNTPGLVWSRDTEEVESGYTHTHTSTDCWYTSQLKKENQDINFLNHLLLSPSLTHDPGLIDKTPTCRIFKFSWFWPELGILTVHSLRFFISWASLSTNPHTFIRFINPWLLSPHLNRTLFPPTRQPKLICSLNSFFTIFLRAHSQCGPRRPRS